MWVLDRDQPRDNGSSKGGLAARSHNWLEKYGRLPLRKLADISRMTRSADPKYPSVRNAYLGSAAAGVVSLGYDVVINSNDPDLLSTGAVMVASFLGWAIARELDPDRQITAMVALAGSALLATWLLPYLLLSAVALGVFRLLVGSVGGGGPTRLDLAVMVALAAYAGWIIDGWFFVVVIAVGIVFSGGWKNLFWATVAVAAGILSALISDTSVHPGNESARFLAYPVLLVIVGLLAWPTNPQSTTDIGSETLSGTRLRTARILAGLALVSAVIASDVYGLTNLGPLTAATVATAVSAPFGRSR